MIENEIVQQLVYFALNFALILSTLLFYAIFAWVIASWFIMFGIITPVNRGFAFLTQIVAALLRPFRWAKIGMIDLSPIAAIYVLHLATTAMKNVLGQFL